MCLPVLIQDLVVTENNVRVCKPPSYPQVITHSTPWHWKLQGQCLIHITHAHTHTHTHTYNTVIEITQHVITSGKWIILILELLLIAFQMTQCVKHVPQVGHFTCSHQYHYQHQYKYNKSTSLQYFLYFLPVLDSFSWVMYYTCLCNRLKCSLWLWCKHQFTYTLGYLNWFRKPYLW